MNKILIWQFFFALAQDKNDLSFFDFFNICGLSYLLLLVTLPCLICIVNYFKFTETKDHAL